MKSLLMASAIGLLAMTSLQAAPPYGGYGGYGRGGNAPGANADFRVERMTAMLGLTPEQQTQLREIFNEQQARRQAMQGAMWAQVDAILTPEQRKRHAQMSQGGGGGPGYGGRGGGGGFRPCYQNW